MFSPDLPPLNSKTCEINGAFCPPACILLTCPRSEPQSHMPPDKDVVGSRAQLGGAGQTLALVSMHSFLPTLHRKTSEDLGCLFFFLKLTHFQRYKPHKMQAELEGVEEFSHFRPLSLCEHKAGNHQAHGYVSGTVTGTQDPTAALCACGSG